LTSLGIDEARAALERGEVLLMDTDSLPGLHALATVEGAAGRLARLKGHAPDRPYLLLAESVDAAFRIGQAATQEQAVRLSAIWPAALTALLRPSVECRPEWTVEAGSVGVRVPASQRLREFLAALDGPLLSTSANKAGCAPAEDLASAARLFPSLPLVRLGTGAAAGPSTIVDCAANPANVVREGVVPWAPE